MLWIILYFHLQVEVTIALFFCLNGEPHPYSLYIIGGTVFNVLHYYENNVAKNFPDQFNVYRTWLSVRSLKVF